MRSGLITTVLLAALAANDLRAQQRPDIVAPAQPVVTDSTYDPVPPADLAFLGLLGAAAGCVPGGLTGALLGAGSGHDVTALVLAFSGCYLGASLGLAGGVHLGNHRRGGFWLDAAASLGAVAAGIGVLVLASELGDGDHYLLAATIPVGQVVLTIMAEKWQERRMVEEKR